MPSDDKIEDLKEVERRRDDAVRRALNTPATPHKPFGKKKGRGKPIKVPKGKAAR